MKEIKPVFAEVDDFECRDRSKLKAFFLESLDHQKSEPGNVMNDFSFDYFCTSLKLLIEILLEKIKLEVARKCEFEKREIWTTLAYFGLIGSSAA